MKLAPIVVTLALPLFVGGCQAMIWGQASAVAASVLIFAGTLALGRSSEPREGARSTELD